jgi:uncharacterized protein (TIGR02145 family)
LYYSWVYATNSSGTTYASLPTFKTLAVAPILKTKEATGVTSTAFTCGGSIENDGGAGVTSRGVCWSLKQNPSIADSFTRDGTGAGSFTSVVTGLTAGKSYYVRAYATNSVSTTYGNQINVLTPTVPVVTTAIVLSVTTVSASTGGNIPSDSGDILARGVCWSTHSSPTISDSKTRNGSGSGSFSSSINGLSPNTIYYVRAYGTNSFGTGYGNEISFLTVSSTGTTITDLEGNVYTTVNIGTQVWMTSNLRSTKFRDGTSIPLVTDNTNWANLSTPAYCWYNNDPSNKGTYGALYNWYTVNTSKVCPTGWHVPTDTEWSALIDYLGGETTVGGTLKEIGTSHWQTPNTNATDVAGFKALPGGYRYNQGSFSGVGSSANWWSAPEFSTSLAWYRYVNYNNNFVGNGGSFKYNGFSIRCLKDN